MKLTEQQALSDAYSQLKIDYYHLKRMGAVDTLKLARKHANLQYKWSELQKKHNEKIDSNKRLVTENERLLKRVKELEEIVEKEVRVVAKEDAGNNQYVTMKTHQKSIEKWKKMVEDYATKYGNMVRKYEELKASKV